jgi:hypothetical protein
MKQCLSNASRRRLTVERLVNDMNLVARDMLKCIGGKAALADMDVEVSVNG